MQVLRGSNKLGIKCKCARTATSKRNLELLRPWADREHVAKHDAVCGISMLTSETHMNRPALK